METLILGPQDLERAGRIIRAGGLVVFPTETVYGLGGDARNTQASTKIYAAKGRPSDNPLIVHLAEIGRLSTVARNVDPVSQYLAETFWPGPLTLILPRHSNLPRATTGGLDTVGVRVPDDHLALDFLRHADVPIAAPSANRSGRPSPTAFWMAQKDLNGRVDAMLQGPDTRIGLESTIVWVSDKKVSILRPGSIGPSQIRQVLVLGGFHDFEVQEVSTSTANVPAAPGTRYRHYSPEARIQVFSSLEELEAQVVTLKNAEPETPYGVLTTHRVQTLPSGVEGPRSKVLVYQTLEEYAQKLYRDLVTLDQEAYGVIFLYQPQGFSSDSEGIVLALVDRIRRAAGLVG
ncbi:MAG: threonylcarbamoyl-AMP synthase [Spirochaetales bacterium]|nr:threonylcarbamoyl-AMP synthase [Spirochaetales bacterium]